jgi:hypothetical protein
MKKPLMAPGYVLTILFTLLFAAPVLGQQIDSVLHSGRKALKPGDKLHVIMTGTSGGTAEVEILGISGTESMPEVSIGRYEADITIPSGMSVNEGTLMVTLNVGGRQVVRDAAKPITILAGGGGFSPTPAPPTRPTPPANLPMFPTTTSPQPGQILSDGLRWDFSATFPVDVDVNTISLFVNGTDQSNQAIRRTSAMRSPRTVSWAPTTRMADGKVTIDLVATSTKGDPLKESYDFFIQGMSTAPAPPATPTRRLSVNNLQGGMLLGNRFAVTGTGIPGSNVLVTVEHPKTDFLSQLAGIMLKFQGNGTVDSSGRYTINLDAGSVKRGRTMNITVTDTSGSSPIRMSCEKGDPNTQIASGNNPTPPPSQPTAPKPTPFFDTQHNYGYDIMPGWSKSVDKNFHSKISKGGHSSFGVAIIPANQSVDDTIKVLGDELINQGGQILSHEQLDISGIPSKAIVVKAKDGSEGVIVVTPKNNMLYVAIVDSSKINSDPAVEREMTQILGSYHLK